MYNVLSAPRVFEDKPIIDKTTMISLIFIIVGIITLLFSIKSIKNYIEKSQAFVETISEVVNYDYESDDTKAIIVEYMVKGKTYQNKSTTYTNVPPMIGTKIPIKYNPKNPQDIIWKLDTTNIITPIIGILFTITGIIGLTNKSKKKKKTKQIINNQGILTQQQTTSNNNPTT